MVEPKKETKEEPQQEQLRQPLREVVKVGDIILESSSYDVFTLSNLIKQILKDKTTEKYLELVKNNKVGGLNYFG